MEWGGLRGGGGHAAAPRRPHHLGHMPQAPRRAAEVVWAEVREATADRCEAGADADAEGRRHADGDVALVERAALLLRVVAALRREGTAGVG